MIIGRFGDTSGRPYIQAQVVFPRLKEMATMTPSGEANVSFLADTGADRTIIMPADWVRFSVDYSLLQNPTEIFGIGGKADGFVEQAIVTFLDFDFTLHVYETDAIILSRSPNLEKLPSIIGREIMNNWSITFDKINARVAARVLKSDHMIKLECVTPSLPDLPGVDPPPPVS
jgi:hypothetical protein